MTPGPTQILIIILLVLVVFGAGRISRDQGKCGQGDKQLQKRPERRG